MTSFTASCTCGDIRLKASGKPLRVGVCHCMDCRKHHGALFYAAAIFSENAVSISGKAKSYNGRFFCSQCGSSVYARSDNEVEIHLGTLDETSQLEPSYECWVEHREAWLPSFPDTHCYVRDRLDSDQDAT